MVGGGCGKATLHDHAIAVAGEPVTRGAIDIVTLAAAGQQPHVNRGRLGDLLQTVEIALCNDPLR